MLLINNFFTLPGHFHIHKTEGENAPGMSKWKSVGNEGYWWSKWRRPGNTLKMAGE